MLKGKVRGEVILSFAVDENGKVVDKRVLTKLSKDADKDALRALSISDKWEPGVNDGKPIKTTMAISVYFKLPE